MADLVVGHVHLQQIDTAIEGADITDVARLKVANSQPHAGDEIEVLESLDVTAAQRDALYVFQLRRSRASLRPQLRVEDELAIEHLEVSALERRLDRFLVSPQDISRVPVVSGGGRLLLGDQLLLEMDPLALSSHLDEPSSCSYHGNHANYVIQLIIQ